MIFVTVGTHEQQFNRLISYVDKIKANGEIDEEVIMQTGFSTYEPQYCQWRKLFSYKDMQKYISEARIVITHGGPSSFIAPLQIGKIPIVVPRKYEFDEHINDHQVTFCKQLVRRNGNIIVIDNINELKTMILNYDNIIAKMPPELKSNNLNFCKNLEKIVIDLCDQQNIILEKGDLYG